MLCWQILCLLLISNHNFLLYHNRFICLGAIAKIFPSDYIGLGNPQVWQKLTQILDWTQKYLYGSKTVFS
ncbi:MAG: hypothetical protein V7K38_13670 [Nostoc sp.]|uniref:hypothetical protein n=1 Tax=Nostoc sp. TaxID=1180 RepID=UPI002FFB3EE6